MSRQVWRDFICAPDRPGRHLSAIGAGVMGASADDAIDLAVLQSFLEKLHNTDADMSLLGKAVDLVTGGYLDFVSKQLPGLLDALSNEMLAQEQVVGPGLRGNPRWDRTLLQRMAGTLSPVHYVSRTTYRSFELPENHLASWLVHEMRGAVGIVEQRVGTKALHPTLRSLREECEKALKHPWLGSVEVPPALTAEMISAARRHRNPAYRKAAELARRRLEMEARDHHARWFTVMALLAVNWLEPVSDDDLFELYVLVLAMDVLNDELGFGEPVEYGLVTARRAHVAMFDDNQGTVRVFFDQTPAAVLKVPTEYGQAIANHAGLPGAERRPDIMLIAKRNGKTRLVLIEMKKSSDGRYISDSVYKVFGYLYDFRNVVRSGEMVTAVLVVPTGIVADPSAPPDREVFVASGDDRAGLAQAMRNALAM